MACRRRRLASYLLRCRYRQHDSALSHRLSFSEGHCACVKHMYMPSTAASLSWGDLNVDRGLRKERSFLCSCPSQS